MSRSRSIALSLLGILMGCASGPKFSEQSLIRPEEGKALIFIYRKNSMMGAGLQPRIFANGELLTKVVSGGYYPYQAAAGRVVFARREGITPAFLAVHVISEAVESKHETFVLEVKAGETFYLECATDGSLTQVDSARGFTEIQTCSLLKKEPSL
jgi:hypothetical protein